jgi:hypothetical protein
MLQKCQWHQSQKRLRDISRLKEIEKAWQLKAVCDLRLDPGQSGGNGIEDIRLYIK